MNAVWVVGRRTRLSSRYPCVVNCELAPPTFFNNEEDGGQVAEEDIIFYVASHTPNSFTVDLMELLSVFARAVRPLGTRI